MAVRSRGFRERRLRRSHPYSPVALPDPCERQPDVEAWNGEVFQQRCGEKAMLPVTIVCRRTGFGGVGNQHIGDKNLAVADLSVQKILRQLENR